jgi:hypothetical protein
LGAIERVLSVFRMRKTTHALTAAALPFVLAVASACASTKASEVKDEQLGQLPREDRQAILEQERSVDVAKSNVDASKAAAKQSIEFRDLVGSELEAAKADRDAADKVSGLSYGTNKSAAEQAAARRQVAAQQVAATEAKSQYAQKLVDVRAAEVEQREAEHTLAQARLERAKYETLKRRGLAEGIDHEKILDAERVADQQRGEAHQKVVQLQGNADMSKTNWDQAQKQYQASAQGTPLDDRAVQPPTGVKYIPQAGAKERN